MKNILCALSLIILSCNPDVKESEEYRNLLNENSKLKELARAKGKYKGRVRGSIESKEEVLAKYPTVIKRLKEGHSLRNAAKLSDVSLGTVQKVKGYLQE